LGDGEHRGRLSDPLAKGFCIAIPSGRARPADDGTDGTLTSRRTDAHRTLVPSAAPSAPPFSAQACDCNSWVPDDRRARRCRRARVRVRWRVNVETLSFANPSACPVVDLLALRRRQSELDDDPPVATIPNGTHRLTLRAVP